LRETVTAQPEGPKVDDIGKSVLQEVPADRRIDRVGQPIAYRYRLGIVARFEREPSNGGLASKPFDQERSAVTNPSFAGARNLAGLVGEVRAHLREAERKVIRPARRDGSRQFAVAN
jgi:hypothetical protein